MERAKEGREIMSLVSNSFQQLAQVFGKAEWRQKCLASSRYCPVALLASSSLTTSSYYALA